MGEGCGCGKVGEYMSDDDVGKVIIMAIVAGMLIYLIFMLAGCPNL